MKESRYNIWVQRDGAFYVYNGVSGALLRLSSEDRAALGDFLTRQQEADCRPALLADLVVGRMLVADDADELGLLAKRYQLSRFDTKRFALTIVTSLGCNFDCPYCFEAKHPSIMSEEVQDAVLAVFDDKLPTIEAFQVCWYGGEPLLGKQALLRLSDAFIQRCDGRSVPYAAEIITNGSLLDEATCAELRDRRVGHAQVTLDGPPEIHDRRRPLASGRGTFQQIVENLHHAVDYFDVGIRINVDRNNVAHAEPLLEILAGAGLAGKLSVYVAQLTASDDGGGAPMTSYGNCGLTNREFAGVEQEFADIAARHGFVAVKLPRPTGAPCTAVRANELVVGSDGELYKCFESVGNPREVVGDIRTYGDGNGRLQKWLKYDPFANEECRGCVALPVCMGGCAHHAFDLLQYENRCGTFRHTHGQQVLRFVDAAERSGSATLMATNQLARALESR